MASKGPHQSSVRLSPLADLFSTQEERDMAGNEMLHDIPLSELYPFPNHPFSVCDDVDMEKLVDSVKENGVQEPAIVRPRQNGGYEIISGHRRKHACELAGITEMSCIIREMDDDTAIILMVENNFQREHIKPSEKAKAYQLRMDALRRKVGRPSKINSAQLEQNFSPQLAVEKVAAEAGTSRAQIQRFIRLNELIPELKKMVDDSKLKFNPAVEISYLTPTEQKMFFDFIDAQECTPSLSQAQQLKAASAAHELTQEKLELIMTSRAPSVKPQEMRVTLPYSQLEKYFPKSVTTEQIVSQIIKLLENQYRHKQRGMER